ncbi:MAG: hypothetical protein II877_08175 [Synergistaceae bacterium]|nr:hypothetical protein [Synergistaceae bacterium]
MSIHSATAQLEKIIEPLIAKFEIEPVGGLTQENMNFMVANAVANGVMQVAYQAAQEVKEEMKGKIISAMEA